VPAPLAAYVLHRWDWSESSLIVELFTREPGPRRRRRQGRQAADLAVASGAAAVPAHSRAAVARPADEAAEVHTLRSAEWGGGAPMLAGAALFRGFYANELLMKLLARQDPHPELFDAYAATLPALGGDEAAAAAALRAFELVLLRETGVLPDLSMLTQTAAPLDAAGRYVLHPEAGVSAAAGASTVEGRIFIAIEAHWPAAIWRRCRPHAAARWRRCACSCARAVDYHLGRAVLRTRQVMLDVRRLTEPPAARR
jgi:DNA repair protein RecO (recombination protein O)